MEDLNSKELMFLELIAEWPKKYRQIYSIPVNDPDNRYCESLVKKGMAFHNRKPFQNKNKYIIRDKGEAYLSYMRNTLSEAKGNALSELKNSKIKNSELETPDPYPHDNGESWHVSEWYDGDGEDTDYDEE